MTKKILNIYRPSVKSKKKVYCSPKNENNKYTCFSRESLLKIVKAWNKSNPKDKISLKEMKKSKGVKKIWNAINKKLKSVGSNNERNNSGLGSSSGSSSSGSSSSGSNGSSNDSNNGSKKGKKDNGKPKGEWCWIQQEFVKNLNDREINTTFRPKTPKEWYSNKNEWLSTIDIENVMKQYEKVHKDFKFIGPVPIDFDYEYSVGSCIVDELCKIDINDFLKRKTRKIGIIFNLDRHDQDGSHWVAMYVDLKKNKIYYFDSYGEEPPKEVDVLAERLKQQGMENNNTIHYEQNDVRFQYKNSECGVYCMYFITSLLKGQSFEEFKANIVPDDEMNAKRGFFYAPNCSV